MKQSPFHGLKIQCSDFLRDAPRVRCPICGKSRVYICYTCNIPINCPEKIARVELPLFFDIIKHPREYMGKSTSPQAVVLAPKCTLFKYPDIPDYDVAKTLLLYPSADSLPLASYVGHCALGDRPTPVHVERIVVVDGTWNQTCSMAKDKRLAKLPAVILKGHPCHYWRFQRGNPATYLSTIEAVYYLCVEYYECCIGPSNSTTYDGRYDNLLFYFKFFYEKMYELHTHQGKSFKVFTTRQEDSNTHHSNT